HSIIVTPEGTEGEAPVLESRNETLPRQETLIEDDRLVETKKPKRGAASKQKVKAAAKPAPSKRAKTAGSKQMTLGFDSAKAGAEPHRKTGKKHGAKKTKK